MKSPTVQSVATSTACFILIKQFPFLLLVHFICHGDRPDIYVTQGFQCSNVLMWLLHRAHEFLKYYLLISYNRPPTPGAKLVVRARFSYPSILDGYFPNVSPSLKDPSQISLVHIRTDMTYSRKGSLTGIH